MPFNVDPRALGAPAASSTPDYTVDLDPTTVLRDPRFRDDLREYFKRRGKTFASDEAMIEAFYEDRVWRNFNSIGIAQDLYAANTADPEQARRQGRIQKVFDALPARPVTEAFGDYAEALLLDPINLVGGAGGVKAGAAAYRAGQTARAATVAGAKAGAVQEGLINAGISGVSDLALQNRNVELGLQDEVSQTQTLASTLAGGAIGGALGGAIGAGTGRWGGRKLADRTIASLSRLGYTADEIASLPEREVARIISGNIVRPTPEAEPSAVPAEPATPADPRYAEADGVDPAVARDAYRAATERYDRAAKDGVSRDVLEGHLEEVVASRELMELSEKLRNMVDRNQPLLGSADARIAEKGAKNQARIERYLALYRRLTASRNDGTIKPGDIAQLKTEVDQASTQILSDPDVAQTQAAQGTEPQASGQTASQPAATPAPEAGAAPAQAGATPPTDPAAGAAPAAAEPAEAAAAKPNATPAALKMLQAAGIDPATITGTGKGGRITNKDAKLAVDSKGVVDEIDAALAPASNPREEVRIAYERVRDEIDEFIKADPEVAPMRNQLIEELAKENFPSIAEDITRYGRATEWNMRDFLGGITDSEYELIERIADSLRMSTPGLSRVDALRQAATGFVKQFKRGNITGKGTPTEPKEFHAGTATSRAMETLAQGPTTAGRNPQTGRVQAILKPGRATERNEAGEATRTVVGVDAPQKSAFVREEAELVAQESKRITAWRPRGNQGFFADIIGGTDRWTYKNRKGEEHTRVGVSAGKQVFYDPQTKRHYASLDLAMAARGDGAVTPELAESIRTIETPTEPTPTKSPEQQKLEKELEDLQARIAAIRGAQASDARAAADVGLATEKNDTLRKLREAASKLRETQTPDQQAAEAAAPPAVQAAAPAADNLAARVQEAIKSGNLARFISDRVKEKSPVAAEAAAKLEATPPPPTGHRLAIRRKSDIRDVRVLTPKQAAEGGTIRSLLGKANPDEWEVGLVPDRPEIKSGSKIASESFKRSSEVSTADATPAADTTVVRADPVPNAKWDGSSFADLGFTDADLAVLSDAYKLANSLHPGGAFKSPEISVAALKSMDKSAGQLFDEILISLENAPIPPDEGIFKRLRSAVVDLYRMYDRVAPGGVEMPVAKREALLADLNTVMSHATPEDIEFVRKLITNAETRGLAPVVKTGPRNTFDALTNVVGISASPSYTPPGAKFAHEFFHWAYRNVMPAQDKIELWDGMFNYYGLDGRLLTNRLEERGPINMAGMSHTERVAVHKGTNFFENFQEIWANQFMLFATGREPHYADMSFWQRVTKFVKAFFDRFIDKKAVDPAFEKVFSRLYPDEAAKKAKTLKSGKMKYKVSPYIESLYVRTYLLEDELRSAIATDSPQAIVDAAQELALMYRQAMSFGPIQARQGFEHGMRAILWSRIKDISDALETDFGDYKKSMDELIGQAIEKSGDENAPVMIEGTPSINVKDPVAASERIKALLDPQNEDDFRNIARTNDMLRSRLEKKFHDFENDTLTLPNIDINFRKRILADRNRRMAERRAHVHKRAEEWKAKKAQSAATAQAEAPRIVAEQPKLRDKPERSGPPQGSDNLKNLSDQEVFEIAIKQRGTKVGDAAAHRVLEIMRSNAAPPAEKVPLTPQIVAMRTPELRDALLSAIEAGDKTRADQIVYEFQRRQFNRSVTPDKKITPLYVVKDADVNSFVQRELADNEVGINDVGIPPNARAPVREVLSYITHRDPEVQYVLRTMTYRMLNMLGKTAREKIDDAAFMSVEELYRLANRAPNATVSGAFADFTDPAFNYLRRDLRRMAVGLQRGVSSPLDVMHEIGHLVVRSGALGDTSDMIRAFDAADDAIKSRILERYSGKYADWPEAARNAKLAEEWFVEGWANYLGERVAKGDTFKLREGLDSATSLSLRSSLGRFLDQLYERVMYLVNGLIGRNDIKQQFRRLTFGGDLFGVKAEQAPLRSIGVSGEVVPAALANDSASESWRLMPKARRAAVKNFVGSHPLSWDPIHRRPVFWFHGSPNYGDLSGNVELHASKDGTNGPGFHFTTDPVIASDTYANAPTFAAMSSLIERSGLAGRDANNASWLAKFLDDTWTEMRKLSRQIHDVSKQIYSTRYQFDTPEDVANKTIESLNGDLVKLVSRLADYNAQAESYVQELLDMGVKFNPGVLPAVVKIQNPADFTVRNVIDQNHPLVSALLRVANARMAEPVDGPYPPGYGAASAIVGALDGASFQMTGVDFYRHLINHADEGIGNLSMARATITDMLKEAGYDSIITSHRRTTNEGWMKPHEVLVVFNESNTGTVTQRVRNINARFEDFGPEARIMDANLNVPSAGAAVLAYNDGVDVLTPGAGAQILDTMDRLGVPAPVTNLVGSMLRRRSPGRQEFDGMNRAMAYAIGSPAAFMEKAGLNWVADFYRNTFVDHTQELAAKIFGGRGNPGFKTLLDALPDAPKTFERWFKNATSFAGPPKQPRSHARIVSALRHGTSSERFARLTPQEKKVAIDIQNQLKREFADMRDAGVWVGHIENYFPQIWSVQKIADDTDGKFKNALADYFIEEHRVSEHKAMPREEALDHAQRVIDRLTDEDGFYVPPPLGSQRQATSDHIDFQRLIRLEDPKFRKNLEALEPFLEDNLEAILVKYYDGTTRRVQQTRKFGVLNHGFYDYLRAIEEGAEGIAHLLAHNRVFRKAVKSRGETGWVETAILEDTVKMPFNGDMESSRTFVKKLVETYKSSGEGAARELMLGLMPFKTMPKHARDTYQHRVDAILAALRDVSGQSRRVRETDIEFAQKAMQIAMRKPADNGIFHGEAARTFSSGIRTFNSVTLLGFTTLTSLPDMVLPLIRSGNGKAWASALKRYAQDPDYREMFKRLGGSLETLLHTHMTGLFQYDDRGRINQFSNAFFNATLLTPWTDLQRRLATAVGFEAFKVDVDKAVRLKVGDGTDMRVQSPEYKRLMRRLNHYGIGHYVLQNKAIAPDPDFQDKDLRMALLKFANETIFSPAPSDIPLWAQTPVGQIIFQLKTYPLLMGRLAKDVLVDDTREFLKTGNIAYLKRPGYFLAAGPALGAAALAIKDVAQARGGEDKRESQVQARNMLKLMGYEEQIHGNENDFLGWYFESMLAMGGLGLVAETIHSVGVHADNGAYGQQRIMSVLLGPSIGTFSAAVNVMGGGLDAAFDSTPDSNAKERTAVRELASRVPLLGGVGAFREATTDALAGERIE